MNIQKFKEEVNRTYVMVHVRNCMSSTKKDDSVRKYNGYIEVPYSYKDFTEFTEEQQKAICQAELCKAGWIYEFIGFSIEVDLFFHE